MLVLYVCEDPPRLVSLVSRVREGTYRIHHHHGLPCHGHVVHTHYTATMTACRDIPILFHGERRDHGGLGSNVTFGRVFDSGDLAQETLSTRSEQ